MSLTILQYGVPTGIQYSAGLIDAVILLIESLSVGVRKVRLRPSSKNMNLSLRPKGSRKSKKRRESKSSIRDSITIQRVN